VLRHSDQVRELLVHDVATTNAAMHDPFVQNAPQVRRIILQQHLLALQSRSDLFVDSLIGCVWLGTPQHRACVLFGLEQAGNEQRLVPAQGLGLFLGLGPAVKPRRIDLLHRHLPESAERARCAQGLVGFIRMLL
jgi:hypothetical protein